jgi:hypothetical protein
VFRRAWLLCAACCAACGSAPGHSADRPPAETPAAGLRLAGTPPGSLVDWVADIRAGLEPVPAMVDTDPAAARRTAVDLYVNRQEWIERYYGPYGTLDPDTTSALGRAVRELEARFHDLIAVLGDTAVKRAGVAAAVQRLDQQAERLLLEATRAAARPIPAAGQDAAGRG